MFRLLTILLFITTVGNSQVINASRYYVPLGLSYFNPNALWLDATNSTSYSGSGTSWYDISGNNITTTLVGSPTFNSTSPKSFTFNGTNQYANTNHNFSIGTNFMSFAFWINYTASQNSGIISQRVGAPTYSQLSVYISNGTNTSGNGTLIVVGDAQDVSIPLNVRVSATPTGYNDGVWHYVSVVRTTTTTDTYIDGSYIISTASTSIPNLSSSMYMYVGQIGNGITPFGGYYFNGKLSTVEVYNYQMTPAQILANYNYKKKYYGR